MKLAGKDESDLPTEFGKTSKKEKNIAVIFKKKKTAEKEFAQPEREQDELEARHDFGCVSGSVTYRQHVRERQTLYVPQVSSISYPTQVY